MSSLKSFVGQRWPNDCLSPRRPHTSPIDLLIFFRDTSTNPNYPSSSNPKDSLLFHFPSRVSDHPRPEDSLNSCPGVNHTLSLDPPHVLTWTVEVPGGRRSFDRRRNFDLRLRGRPSDRLWNVIRPSPLGGRESCRKSSSTKRLQKSNREGGVGSRRLSLGVVLPVPLPFTGAVCRVSRWTLLLLSPPFRSETLCTSAQTCVCSRVCLFGLDRFLLSFPLSTKVNFTVAEDSSTQECTTPTSPPAPDDLPWCIPLDKRNMVQGLRCILWPDWNVNRVTDKDPTPYTPTSLLSLSTLSH